jgi:uncharacterized protein (DUF488 family)
MGNVWTIGHSTHPLESFLALLATHQIDAIGDVRSEPFSARRPEYSRESLRTTLAARGIAYVFLGRELGARPRDDAMYADGRVQFDRLARTPRFEEGIVRVQKGLSGYRLALLCAEGDPLLCHRSLLIAPALVAEGVEVMHIRPDGRLESQAEAMERLLELHHLPPRDVFGEQTELLELATSRQEGRIAFRRAKGSLEL